MRDTIGRSALPTPAPFTALSGLLPRMPFSRFSEKEVISSWNDGFSGRKKGYLKGFFTKNIK